MPATGAAVLGPEVVIPAGTEGENKSHRCATLYFTVKYKRI